MYLTGYTKELFRPKCNHNFQSVHCVAHLNEDVSEALPYLNTALGGSDYVNDPPALTLRVHGKLITVHARDIFINALNDEFEAEKILAWLIKEINETWEARGQIQPTFTPPPVPRMLDVLRLLPRTNCGRCGEPTCMVFAVRVTEGVKGPEHCPDLDDVQNARLSEYLSEFVFDR
jgi:ArsR family metal-binding transcriptional regulator